MKTNVKAWSDAPMHVTVRIGAVDFILDVADAIDLHRQIFHATVQATTDSKGRWAWEDPDLQKDPP